MISNKLNHAITALRNGFGLPIIVFSTRPSWGWSNLSKAISLLLLPC